jgi:hypothetical protein
MLFLGARTIERPRLVEPPDDIKGYLLARLDHEALPVSRQLAASPRHLPVEAEAS